VEFDKEPYLLSIITDITQRKRMEEENLRLNSDLQGANSELKSFNYTVAHDLRKPLTVINGYCQVLLELCSDRLDEECIGYLDETYEASLRMNRLIDSLLLFSQAAYSELKRERVNLSEFARETARELETAEPERKVIFRIEEGIEAEGDANLLRAVLANLFGNAWKYTSETADARIEFGAEMTPKGFSCFVRDNGMGFDAAEAGEIFTPFRRLSRGERIGGLGIGLATVQRVVSRHGGTVWAEGTPGAGATFYFQLPQTQQGQPDRSPPRPA
jgi:light-regulated signal transduction histidine kinase (bacteriophytochrome)